MNQVLDYHPEDFDVIVEPGVTREDLNHYVKNDGNPIALMNRFAS